MPRGEAGFMLKVSTDFVEISEAEARANPLADAWQDPSIPAQQLKLTDGELLKWSKGGESIAPFDALSQAVLRTAQESTFFQNALEIGCGVGHGVDIVRWSAGYIGVDYSEEFIRVARERRPYAKFEVMDALMLDYPDRSFDVAISSCCILHIVNWRIAVKEAARVAKRYLILHRTPVSSEPTRYFFKKAYGVQCVEIHFNEKEVLDEVAGNDFAKIAEFHAGTDQKTYLFERALAHHPV